MLKKILPSLGILVFSLSALCAGIYVQNPISITLGIIAVSCALIGLIIRLRQ